MKRLVAVALLLLIPRGIRADAGDDDRIVSAYKALDFVHGKSAKVAKLTEPADRKGKFFTANVVSPWQDLKPAQWHALTTLVQQALEKEMQYSMGGSGDGETVRLAPFCLASPVFGVRMETDKGSREVAICFRCDTVDVGDKYGRTVEFYPGDGLLGELKACYRDAFGEDLPAASPKPAK